MTNESSVEVQDSPKDRPVNGLYARAGGLMMFVLLLLASWQIVAPFAVALAWAISLAVSVHPAARTRLTPERVSEARERSKRGETLPELATFLGVHPSHARRVISGEVHK